MSEQTHILVNGLQNERSARHPVVALSLAALVVAMLGLSYAAVPLYQMFCQVTGYGGTTQKAESAPDIILNRKMKIRFDANTARGMAWKFHPVQRTVDIKIGETALIFYEAQNLHDKAIRGTATFNVTPEAAGVYFSKIECFCFTEQVLQPGQRVDMPVSFFIDPEIVDDPATANIKEITLSYTFFPVKEDKDSIVNSSAADKKAKQGS